MGGEGVDRAHGENGTDAERHRSGVPHFQASRVERVGQGLATPFGGGGKAVPAGLRPVAIGVPPAGRHGDHAVGKRRAMGIADPVEWRDDVAGKPAGLGQNGRDQIIIDVGEQALGAGGGQAGAMVEGENEVGDGRAVGHERSYRLCRQMASVIAAILLIFRPIWSALRRWVGSGGGSRPEPASCTVAEPPMRYLRPIYMCRVAEPGRRRPRDDELGCDRGKKPPDHALIAAISAAIPTLSPRPGVAPDRAGLTLQGTSDGVLRGCVAGRRGGLGRVGGCSAVGRSQVVRQRILIPPFPGSNPGAPASAQAAIAIH